MNNLVLIKYSVDSRTIDRFIRRYSRIFNIIIVDNSPDSEILYNDTNIIKGKNHFREFSGMSEALNCIDTKEISKVFFCNDTVLMNRCTWKLDHLSRKLKHVNVIHPTIFGFLDKSFEFFSDLWFLRNGCHIRTDVFALNSNGIDLFKEIMVCDFDSMFADDSEFNEVVDDFMDRHHKSKLGQRKEIATFIELYISTVFHKKGFIYDARDSGFKLRQSFDRLTHRILKK